MVKSSELSDPNSCLNRASDDEILFVLRSHDVSAPAAIREWVRSRIVLGKNMRYDAQIREAWDCASAMEAQRKAAEGRKTERTE